MGIRSKAGSVFPEHPHALDHGCSSKQMIPGIHFRFLIGTYLYRVIWKEKERMRWKEQSQAIVLPRIAARLESLMLQARKAAGMDPDSFRSAHYL